MAEKKTNEAKIIVERTYNVPLRKGFQKAPKYRRAKKAINVLREFLAKHMKSEDVRIGRHANLKLWERGIKNPPHHVKVNATRDTEGVVRAEIVGAPVEKKAEEAPKKSSRKAKKEETDIKKALGTLEEKTEKLKKEKQTEAKEVEKEEIKELKDKPLPSPKDAKIAKPEPEQKTDTKPKAVSAPRGGQKLEPHHGEGKQQKK